MKSGVSGWVTEAVRVARAMAVLSVFAPEGARADVTHVVGKGHTVEAIAHRYRVPVKAILDANHLKEKSLLQVGETLTIPGVAASTTNGKNLAGVHAKAAAKEAAKEAAKPVVYAMRPKTPGIVHATRLATSESFSIKVSDRKNKIAPAALKSFEHMMRSSSNLAHPIEPRLIALLSIVSNHFGSRPLQVISGFRPYAPTQHTSHSNHNIGHAVDFRVVGVPNEVVRDFCRTLRNVGVGYYPHSTFVHLDVRETSTFWIDYSRPGEPPRYNSPNVDADEGTSDVANDAHGMESTPMPPPTPTAPPDLPALDVLPNLNPGRRDDSNFDEDDEAAGTMLNSAATGTLSVPAEPMPASPLPLPAN
jgi:uncharacterized protein YcbK (DUF882 family)